MNKGKRLRKCLLVLTTASTLIGLALGLDMAVSGSVYIGSGMVESTCKWLRGQRFKGVGMRWGEDGFNHLLHLRLAWMNQRFDSLFSNEPLALSLYSPTKRYAHDES